MNSRILFPIISLIITVSTITVANINALDNVNSLDNEAHTEIDIRKLADQKVEEAIREYNMAAASADQAERAAQHANEAATAIKLLHEEEAGARRADEEYKTLRSTKWKELSQAADEKAAAEYRKMISE